MIKYKFGIMPLPKPIPKNMIQFSLIPRDALRVSMFYLSTDINRLLTENEDHSL